MDLIVKHQNEITKKSQDYEKHINSNKQLHIEKLEKAKNDEDIKDTFDFIGEIISDDYSSILELYKTYNIDDLEFKLKFIIAYSHLHKDGYPDIKVYINDEQHSSISSFTYENIGARLTGMIELINNNRYKIKKQICELLDSNFYVSTFSELLTRKLNYITEDERVKLTSLSEKLKNESEQKALKEKENRDKIDELLDNHKKYEQRLKQKFEEYREELTKKYWAPFVITIVEYAPSSIVYIENASEGEVEFLQTDTTVDMPVNGWYTKLDVRNNRLTKKRYANLVSEEIIPVKEPNSKYCLKLDISQCFHGNIKFGEKYIYVNPNKTIELLEEDYWDQSYKSLDDYMFENGYERGAYGNWIKTPAC